MCVMSVFVFLGGICSQGKDLTSSLLPQMKMGLNQQLVVKHFPSSNCCKENRD